MTWPITHGFSIGNNRLSRGLLCYFPNVCNGWIIAIHEQWFNKIRGEFFSAILLAQTLPPSCATPFSRRCLLTQSNEIRSGPGINQHFFWPSPALHNRPMSGLPEYRYGFPLTRARPIVHRPHHPMKNARLMFRFSRKPGRSGVYTFALAESFAAKLSHIFLMEWKAMKKYNRSSLLPAQKMKCVSSGNFRNRLQHFNNGSSQCLPDRIRTRGEVQSVRHVQRSGREFPIRLTSAVIVMIGHEFKNRCAESTRNDNRLLS